MLTHIRFKLVELEDTSYHLLIPVLFNDVLKANLIIDTGASKSIFDYSQLKDIANNIETVENNISSGINSYIDTCYIAHFNRFTIGSLKVEPFNAILMDLSHVNELYAKIGQGRVLGLLGSDFLAQYKAVLSFASQRLSLYY